MSIPGANKSFPYWPGNYPENGANSSVIPGLIMLWPTSTIPNGWLLCDGANVLSSEYPNLLNAIGYTYSAGAANAFGAIAVNGGYSYVSNTITISGRAEQENFFINVGSIVKLIGSTPATGVSMTGRAILITSAPAINTTGGVFEGTFVNTLAGTGTGNAGIIDMLRLTFQVPNTVDRTIRSAGPEFVLGSIGGSDSVTLAIENVPPHAHKLANIGSNSQGFTGGGGDGSVDNNPANSPQLNSNMDIYNADGDIVTANEATPSAVIITNPYMALNYIIKT